MDFPNIPVPSHTPALDLLEKPPSGACASTHQPSVALHLTLCAPAGILVTLDEQHGVRMNDAKMLTRFRSRHDKHPCFRAVSATEFEVKHFEGPVRYTMGR